MWAAFLARILCEFSQILMVSSPHVHLGVAHRGCASCIHMCIMYLRVHTCNKYTFTMYVYQLVFRYMTISLYKVKFGIYDDNL